MSFFGKNKKLLAFLVFFGGMLFFRDNVFAVGKDVVVTSKGDVVLYTFNTQCPNPNFIKVRRGIIVPKTISKDTTYVYFHGNDPLDNNNPDKLSVEEMCDGVSPDGKSYNLCSVVAQLKAPMIVPETKRPGTLQSLDKSEIECLLSEVMETFEQKQDQNVDGVIDTPKITLPSSHVFAGHSGGANSIRLSFNNGIPADGALIFDGCYTNWCTQIANKVAKVFIYYGKNTQDTPEKSKAAYESAKDKISLFEVNADHYAIPTICFLDHSNNDRCQGKAVPWPAPTTQKWCLTPENTCNEGAGGGCPRLFDTEAACMAAKGEKPEDTAGGGSSETGSSASQLTQFANQLNKIQTKSLPVFIGILIRGVMGIIGTIALIMILYGGVLWMTARGNSEQLGKARDTILWAALGIVVLFASYALVNFVFEIFR